MDWGLDGHAPVRSRGVVHRHWHHPRSPPLHTHRLPAQSPNPLTEPAVNRSGGAPPIGQRTQIAFILKRYQFSGCSLWDGNSDADVTGSSTVPLLSDIAGNRGTPNSGYAQQLPYARIGNSTYTPPDSNNTNKTYNTTLSATISGKPIHKPLQAGTESPDVDRITKNLSSLKGDIWDNWLGKGKTKSERAKASRTRAFQHDLQHNYGSGFEIEAYVFPYEYPTTKPMESVWLDNIELSDYQFQASDFESINFATDSRDSNAWYTTNKSKVINSIRDFVAGSIQAQVAADPAPPCSTAATSYTFGSNQGWVHREGLVGTLTNFNVTLTTGVMLPDVGLKGASRAGTTANEFSSYLTQGYDTNGVQFWDLGQVYVSVIKSAGSGTYTIAVDYAQSAQQPTHGAIASSLETKFNNEGLFVRGNDGQFPSSLDTVRDYLSGSDPKPYGTGKNNVPMLQSNPWQNLSPNIGPAYSATLLNLNILYPLLWYDPAYVDPFHAGC